MKSRPLLRAAAGIFLCAVGLRLALKNPYTEKAYVINAGSCPLEMSVWEKPGAPSNGSVVLFHGLSANKRIMAYLAQAFAEAGFRVYVPDFPGHGRSKGSFSPAHAEECAESLVRGLLARGVLTPDRTILAGHSMGAAIATQVANRVHVAAVVAVSPAPTRAAHGVLPAMVLFNNFNPPPPNTLILSGALEPLSMRGNAADFAAQRADENVKYSVVPGATHVGILFSSVVARASQEWAAQNLHFTLGAGLPSHRPLIGFLCGFVGLLLIAVPFLREAVGWRSTRTEQTEAPDAGVGMVRAAAEFIVASLLVLAVLRFWMPLRAIRLFQGDYFASFLLLFGIVLTVLHWKSVRAQFSAKESRLMSVAFTALVLVLLFTAWMDLTFYESWLGLAKWARLPFLVLFFLPYHLAEESMLGDTAEGRLGRRFIAGLVLRLLFLGALMAGVHLFHSGQVLMTLLAPYLALSALLSRRGMDIVRQESGSALASALFGAILLAGFCLVIFPVT